MQKAVNYVQTAQEIKKKKRNTKAQSGVLGIEKKVVSIRVVNEGVWLQQIQGVLNQGLPGLCCCFDDQTGYSR